MSRREELNRAFALIEQAAIKGARCPQNTGAGVNGEVRSDAVVALCREGRILVEVSGRNWRQATILTGPHAGKKTAPNPRGHHVYKTVGKETPLDTSVARRVAERREPTPKWLRAVKF